MSVCNGMVLGRVGKRKRAKCRGDALRLISEVSCWLRQVTALLSSDTNKIPRLFSYQFWK